MTADIISKDQACELLGISMRKLEGLIKDRVLPVTRLGRRVRINRADVMALVPAQLPAKPIDGYKAKPEGGDAGESAGDKP
jgi:excisionase family DNA binding protein